MTIIRLENGSKNFFAYCTLLYCISRRNIDIEMREGKKNGIETLLEFRSLIVLIKFRHFNGTHGSHNMHDNVGKLQFM